ncbi:MAG: NupC/NupG family nucleoside CNT transporter [Deltaproteobacteria bacterium]|nr:NupC/NupG family nucleoside CNT transporter [Deltaproteobacteria bacterium]
MFERIVSAIGLLAFVAVAWALSANRRAVSWRPVAWGAALQFAFAFLILKTDPGYEAFKALGDLVTRFLDFSDAGARFVFGERFAEFFFAFKVLPTIIFFSAFITVLYHYNVLQRVVRVIAWVMQRSMGTSGAETFSCAANIFVGQTEAPLLVKPFVATLTPSELHAVMCGGFATISGGVMAAYMSFGVPAEHLIAASVMSAPAALAIAKLMYPETGRPLTAGTVRLEVERPWANGIDAAAAGASDGMKLCLNVAAMLIAFLALLAVLNALLGWAGGLFGFPALSLEWVFAKVLAPLAWLMGVPWEDCGHVGVLLGKKTILNEFIAYLDLKQLIENGRAVASGAADPASVPVISERAQVIATYALCGFSNVASIGIQIGGIGAMAPSRQADLARVGLRAMVAGSIACFMTACIAGILL